MEVHIQFQSTFILLMFNAGVCMSFHYLNSMFGNLNIIFLTVFFIACKNSIVRWLNMNALLSKRKTNKGKKEIYKHPQYKHSASIILVNQHMRKKTKI